MKLADVELFGTRIEITYRILRLQPTRGANHILGSIHQLASSSIANIAVARQINPNLHAFPQSCLAVVKRHETPRGPSSVLNMFQKWAIPDQPDFSKENEAAGRAGWACSTADYDMSQSVCCTRSDCRQQQFGKLWCGKGEAKEPGQVSRQFLSVIGSGEERLGME